MTDGSQRTAKTIRLYEATYHQVRVAAVTSKPQSTERGRVRGLLKKQKGAPLNLG